MPAIAISAVVGGATLTGGLAGLFLQSFLPEKHTTDRSRDMLAAIVGLVSLLLALVLGTLIGSAYSFYSTQKAEMETLAARSLQLDLSLAQYGPEAAPLRSALRGTLAGIDNVIWGDGRSDPQQFKAAAVLPELAWHGGAVLGPEPNQRRSAAAPWGHRRRRIADPANKASDVTAAGQPDFLAAPDHCRVLVDLAVLRVRNSIETERHDSSRACPWIFRNWQSAASGDATGDQRDISHPRIERALQRDVKVPRAAMQQAIEALD